MGVRQAGSSIALPRIRDFHGLSPKQFDVWAATPSGWPAAVSTRSARGQRLARVGADINVVTSRRPTSRALLRALGFPLQGTEQMAKKAHNKAAEFAVRAYTVQQVRPPRAVYRKFRLCRICTRDGTRVSCPACRKSS